MKFLDYRTRVLHHVSTLLLRLEKLNLVLKES